VVPGRSPRPAGSEGARDHHPPHPQHAVGRGRRHPVPLVSTTAGHDGAGTLLDVSDSDAGGASPARLRVASTRPRPGVSVVRVSGEIDLVDACRLDHVLQAAVVAAATSGRLDPHERPRVVCDLDGVEFLGAAGLGVLANAVVTARTHAVELVCFTVRRSVRQVIRLTALDRALSLIPTDLETAPVGNDGATAAWSA
jgi:anti-sigma B factor antagonist